MRNGSRGTLARGGARSEAADADANETRRMRCGAVRHGGAGQCVAGYETDTRRTPVGLRHGCEPCTRRRAAAGPPALASGLSPAVGWHDGCRTVYSGRGEARHRQRTGSAQAAHRQNVQVSLLGGVHTGTHTHTHALTHTHTLTHAHTKYAPAPPRLTDLNPRWECRSAAPRARGAHAPARTCSGCVAAGLRGMSRSGACRNFRFPFFLDRCCASAAVSSDWAGVRSYIQYTSGRSAHGGFRWV